jgi:hypothetical protein
MSANDITPITVYLSERLTDAQVAEFLQWSGISDDLYQQTIFLNNLSELDPHIAAFKEMPE